MAINDHPGPKLSAKTGTLPLAFLVLILSLATWYFFYLQSMPLTAGDTAVVVVFWIVVVVAGQWLLSRYLSQKKKNGKSKKKSSAWKSLRYRRGPHGYYSASHPPSEICR